MVDYNQLAREYALHRQVHPEVLRALVAYCPINRTSRVLEVGCGTGNYIAQVQAAIGCSCYGLDPSSQMLRQAATSLVPYSCVQARAEALAFAGNLFDFVFSVDVIHHVTDRAAYFREAMRVLKPGGMVCTVTDSEWIIRNRVPLSSYFPGTVEPELRRYPKMNTLHNEMRESGFTRLHEELVEYTYSLKDTSPFRAKVYSALHTIDPSDFEFGLARMEHDLQAGPIPCVSRYVLVWGLKQDTPVLNLMPTLTPSG